MSKSKADDGSADRGERGEDRLLGWLRRQADTGLLGDDAAVLPPSRGVDVTTVDSQIAGVHIPADLDAGILARRLVHVNLSDLAAMGATEAPSPDNAPADRAWCHALVSITAPDGFDHRHFFTELLDECAATGVVLAGGDLAASPTLTATMTLIAHRQRDWVPVRRTGCRPGDGLWVGGTLGESGAGALLVQGGARLSGSGERGQVYLPSDLYTGATVAESARRAVRRHLEPAAQIALGAWLSRSEENRAGGLDLSDGLGRDLPRLARESGVGAEVDVSTIPVSDGFHALCAALNQDPIDLVLGGGEDYVLLFTLPSGVAPPDRFGCCRIGRITKKRELILLRDGHRDEWPTAGWDHLEQG